MRHINNMMVPFATLVWILTANAQNIQPTYKDPSLPVEERVSDLLKKMTLEEKIAQLQCLSRNVEGSDLVKEQGIGCLTGGMLRSYSAGEAAEKMNRIQRLMVEQSRLGIPVLMHEEALHGLAEKGATSFPQAIGLASTWDTGLMERVATAIAVETKSRGIRQVLSPVVNIARDVRWGRVEETYGEDPYLTSRMGVAFCRSFEREGVITTPKHYTANIGDGGRDSNAVHFTERLLREIYFPGFKACIQEAGSGSIMAAYNSYDGTPCSASKWLLTDILRGEWGFKGFVVSDYGSVAGILRLHHTAANEKEAAQQAIEAGLDVEFPNITIYGEPLLQAVKEGLVSESTIDKSVQRLLEAKFRLGLFESPYVDPEYAAKVNDSQEHRRLALEAAREAIVLLKNDNDTLPLRRDIKSIAVLGPLADKVKLGGYSGHGMKTVSVLEGMKNRLSSQTRIYFERGAEVRKVKLAPIPSEYLIPAGARRGEQGLKGEYFNNRDLSGEPALSRTDRQLHFSWTDGSPDPKINADRFSARWTGKLVSPVSGTCKIGITADAGARLYIDGNLLIDKWASRSGASDSVALKTEKGRQYDIRLEFRKGIGDAFASLGWDQTSDKTDAVSKAVAVARKSEAAVVVVGIIEGEDRDRANLNLSGSQEELIKAVAKTGIPTVVVLINGSAITMENWIDHVSAVVEAWYPGEEGGNAIADILFGEYNPGGKLPITFPQSVAQVPLYYNPKPSGRGYDYVDMSGKPLFPFGHGLSYTEFGYTNLEVSPPTIKAGESAHVRLDVQNTGRYEGDEVVQLYLHDIVGSVSRPLKELKGFQRISLSPNEKKTITFDLTPELLSMFDLNMNWVVEPGSFEVMVGSSSDDIRLRSSLEVVGG